MGLGREMGWGWRWVEEKDEFGEGFGLHQGVGLTRRMSLGEICIWGGSWAGGRRWVVEREGFGEGDWLVRQKGFVQEMGCAARRVREGKGLRACEGHGLGRWFGPDGLLEGDGFWWRLVAWLGMA